MYFNLFNEQLLFLTERILRFRHSLRIYTHTSCCACVALFIFASLAFCGGYITPPNAERKRCEYKKVRHMRHILFSCVSIVLFINPVDKTDPFTARFRRVRIGLPYVPHLGF